MKAVIYYKDGKKETYDVIDGSYLDLTLAKKIKRPEDRHFIDFVSLGFEDIKRVDILNENN